MNTVVIGRKKFTGPASWAEITPRQLLQFLGWRVRMGGDPAGRFVLLQLWYGIRYRSFRLLADEQRTDLLAVLDFLDERPDRWLLPTLRLYGRTYIGPGDGLDYLSFGEFVYAQAARDRYLDGQQPAALAELIAALYRPRAFFWQSAGDAHRQLFDARRHTQQSRRLESLPVTVLQGILMNYEGCLDRFPAQFPHLFGGSGGDGEAGTWLDVGLSLARQTSALGTFAEMERGNLFLVLTTLDALMKENAELKAKLEHGQS